MADIEHTLSQISAKRWNEILKEHRERVLHHRRLAEVEHMEAKEFIGLTRRQRARARNMEQFLPESQTDEWPMENSSRREDFEGLLARLNNSKLDFLHTDLDTGLTMAQMAADANRGSEKRLRNARNARTAYNAVLRFRHNVVMTEDESRALDEKMRQLRVLLVQLGKYC